MITYKHLIDDGDKPGLFCPKCDDGDNMTVTIRGTDVEFKCENCHIFWDWDLKNNYWEESGNE